jgi:hypothetical protein
MMLHFEYLTPLDQERATRWNPKDVDPKSIDTNDSTYFFTQFDVRLFMDGSVGLLANHQVTWINKLNHEKISIFLTHYNPLRNIKSILLDNSINYTDLDSFHDSSSNLSQEYTNQLVSFQSEMNELGEMFSKNVIAMVNQADLIICCYGDFMESPYRDKHIFQGMSRGKVYVDTSPDGHLRVQGSLYYE